MAAGTQPVDLADLAVNPTHRWGLTLAVMVAHLLGVEWVLAQHGGLSQLTDMPAATFTQVVDAVSHGEAAPQLPLQLGHPAPTIGQRVQARHVTLMAATPAVSAATPPSIARLSPTNPTNTKAANLQVDPASTELLHLKGSEASAEFSRQPDHVVPGGTAPDSHTVLNAQEPTSPPSPAEMGSSSPSTEAWRHWPESTRLVYQLKGFFRGEFSGSAKVDWQRQNERYQAQVAVDVALLVRMSFTSQGRIQPQQLWPEVYEEDRRGKRRSARFTEQWVTLDNGTQLPRPEGLQDTASQFVQLAQDFRSGRLLAQTGQVVSVMLGRPGGVDLWQYDLTPNVVVDTPLGSLETIHLKPRPLEKSRGTVTAEMWFAPKLQHLPVRIRLQLTPETWLDLTLQQVLQAS